MGGHARVGNGASSLIANPESSIPTLSAGCPQPFQIPVSPTSLASSNFTAIKVLLPEVSKDADMAARFFNEARAVNIIRHPGIVSVSDLGQLPDGSAYIVMEYLEGESLRTRLARGLLKSSGLRLVRQIAAALAAAHSKGIIHRAQWQSLFSVGEPEI